MEALPFALFGLVFGGGVGRLAGPQLLAGLGRSSLVRVNYRGRVVVAGLGLALPLGLLAWAALLALLGRVDVARSIRTDLIVSHQAVAVVLAGLAFALLGLVDDLTDDGDVRGFRGHLRALKGGRLTGGGVKLAGGALAGLLVASLAVEHRSVWLVLAGGVVVASAANLANLLDLRPGRTAKLFLLLWLAGAAAAPAAGAWSAGLAGAAAGVLPLELREEGMLGDTGANALGAVTGALIVASASPAVLLATAVLLAALQGASERVSFTRVIERTPWLRRLDELGRRTPEGPLE